MITFPDNQAVVALLPAKLEPTDRPDVYRAFWGAQIGQMFGIGRHTYLIVGIVPEGQETTSNSKLIRVMPMAGPIEKQDVAISDPKLFTIES